MECKTGFQNIMGVNHETVHNRPKPCAVTSETAEEVISGRDMLLDAAGMRAPDESPPVPRHKAEPLLISPLDTARRDKKQQADLQIARADATTDAGKTIKRCIDALWSDVDASGDIENLTLAFDTDVCNICGSAASCFGFPRPHSQDERSTS